MSAVAKLRDQVSIARQTGNYVVLTADEAQAVVEEIMDGRGDSSTVRRQHSGACENVASRSDASTSNGSERRAKSGDACGASVVACPDIEPGIPLGSSVPEATPARASGVSPGPSTHCSTPPHEGDDEHA